MPFQIPSYVPQVRLPGPTQTTRAGPEAAGAAGSTVARAGALIVQHAERWKQEQDIAAASEVVANTAGELGRVFYDQQARAPDGAQGFADSYRTAALDLINQRVADLPQGAQQFARNRLLGHYTSWVDSAWRYEATSRREWQVRTTGRALDTFAGNVRQDPASLEQTITDATAAIDGSGLGPSDRQRLIDQTRPRLAFEAIRGMAERDPAGARAMLDGPAGQMLDERQRTAAERLIGQGRGRVSQDAAAGEAEANRVRIVGEEGARLGVVRQQQSHAQQGFEMLSQGSLTATWVEQNRHVLSPADYRVFRLAASGAARVVDAPEVVADLHDALDDGDPQAFAQQAARHVEGGRLTPESYARLVRINRDEAWTNSAAGMRYRSLRDSLRPPTDGPMRQVVDDERAAALEHWRRWSEANPNASDSDFQRAGETFRRQAMQRMWTRIAPTLPLPEGYGGSRDTMEPAEIDRLERETVQAMDRRQIAPSEAMRRLRGLRQWRYALPLRQETQPNTREAR